MNDLQFICRLFWESCLPKKKDWNHFLMRRGFVVIVSPYIIPSFYSIFGGGGSPKKSLAVVVTGGAV